VKQSQYNKNHSETRSKKIVPSLPFNSEIIKLGIKENLSTSEVLLLFVLRTKMNEKNKKCWPSQKTLAEQVRVTDKWIRSRIKKFKKMGILQVNKRKKRNRYGNNSYEYRFVYPWKIKDSANLYYKEKETEPEFTFPIKEELSSPIKAELSSQQTGGQFQVNPEPSSYQPGSQFLSTRNSVPENKEGNKDMNKPVEINSSSINQEPDDEASKALEKPLTSHQIEHDCSMDLDHSNEEVIYDSSAFEVSAPPLPRKLKRGDLKKYYASKVPKARDLNEHSNGYINLSKYVAPFRKGSICIECFGSDFSQRMPNWWERQFEDYYERAIKLHWDHTSYSPGEGFKTQFRRACVAGVMARNGFNPLTPAEQEEYEKLKEKEKRQRIKEQLRVEQEIEKQKIERDKLRKKISKIFLQLPQEDKNEISMQLDFVPSNLRSTIKDEVDLILYTLQNGIPEIGAVSIREMFQEDMI
jgi:hypothetical protein